LIFIVIGPRNQHPLGTSNGWWGWTPTVHGLGWWDARFDRFDFVWFKSSFALAIGLLTTFVGYAAGTSRQLVRDMREAKRARETALLADLLPHPVLLIAIILFVIGLVLGSVGAACYNDTLVGTTCSYTASVWLLSVGWPLAGVSFWVALSLPQLLTCFARWSNTVEAHPVATPIHAGGRAGAGSPTKRQASSGGAGGAEASLGSQRTTSTTNQTALTATITPPLQPFAISPTTSRTVSPTAAATVPGTPKVLPVPPTIDDDVEAVCDWLSALGMQQWVDHEWPTTAATLHLRRLRRGHLEGGKLE